MKAHRTEVYHCSPGGRHTCHIDDGRRSVDSGLCALYQKWHERFDNEERRYEIKSEDVFPALEGLGIGEVSAFHHRGELLFAEVTLVSDSTSRGALD